MRASMSSGAARPQLSLRKSMGDPVLEFFIAGSREMMVCARRPACRGLLLACRQDDSAATMEADAGRQQEAVCQVTRCLQHGCIDMGCQTNPTLTVAFGRL